MTARERAGIGGRMGSLSLASARPRNTENMTVFLRGGNDARRR